MKKVLTKADTLGRIIKWSIELAEFGVNYDPRTVIKGQVLAYFMVECSFERSSDATVNLTLEMVCTIDNQEGWSVYVDGSVAKIGSGANVLVANLNNNKWKYGLSTGFQALNNITEYEALILGLQLARQLGAKDLTIHTDSQLVAKQINGKYVKEARLKKYHMMANQFLTGFDKAKVRQLPRDDSTRSNALSKLPSSITIEQRRKILLEHREAPSYDALQILCMVVKKGFSHLLLQCLFLSEAEYIMREIYKGICDDHSRGRLLAQKILRQGYY
ncbi:Integrase, catalytic core [Gossypium australe]|uniref:Integrase, catalytic core n=1 Tax=Gossypium australe TaxID=47621 RepID=A0A5B6WRX7_9ROSI|nr:Integrase, catalytic core [Gossypium australe]